MPLDPTKPEPEGPLDDRRGQQERAQKPRESEAQEHDEQGGEPQPPLIQKAQPVHEPQVITGVATG